MWTKHDRFIEYLKEAQNSNLKKEPWRRLWKLNKNLAACLKIQNQNVLGDITQQTTSTKRNVDKLENSYANDHSPEAETKLWQAQMELLKLISIEEELLLQKATMANFID